MKFCDECRRWGTHATGCPNEPAPELTVCADCLTEVEEVEICHGDIAPAGADCKVGLYYCRDCYNSNHVRHEDSERGEQLRLLIKQMEKAMEKTIREYDSAIDTFLKGKPDERTSDDPSA